MRDLSCRTCWSLARAGGDDYSESMPRVLLLLPTTTYRAKAFIDAALRIGVDVVAASERPSTLEARNPAGLLTLDFVDPEVAARQASRFAEQYTVDAIIPAL